MSDTEKLDALLAAYNQAEAELYSILNHFDRRGLLPDNVTPQDVQEAVALLFERLDKQDRILAALRKPSEAMVEEAASKMHDAAAPDGDQRIAWLNWSDCISWYRRSYRKMATAALRAAVAAAEREVGK